MENIVYIPYANTDPANFLYRGEKKLTEKVYVNMEIKEYEDHKDGVDYMMSKDNGFFGYNIADNDFEKRVIRCKQQTYSHWASRCRLLDKSGRPLSYNEIVTHIHNRDRFVFILQLKVDDIKNEPDLLIDIKQWTSESNKILNCDRITDEEKIIHLPMKDLSISCKEFPNSTNLLNVIFRECKIVELKGLAEDYELGQVPSTFAILVKRLDEYRVRGK